MKKYVKCILAALCACCFMLAACQNGEIKISVLDEGFVKDYYVGQQIDYRGLFLSVEDPKLSSPEKVQVTADMVTGADTATAGEKTLTITYKGRTAEVKITVTLRTLEGIELDTTTFPLEYMQYDDIDYSQLKINLNFDNDTQESIMAEEGMYTPVDVVTPGEKVLIVTYQGKEASVTITITELSEETDSSYFNFARMSDGTYSITAKISAPASIVLPRRYNDQWVTEIGENAFAGKNVRAIVIYEKVTRIGKAAFKDCDSLENVVMSKNITEIGSEAFYGCSRLVILNFPSELRTIGVRAFRGCGIVNVSLGEHVTRIMDAAFAYSNVFNVSMKNQITEIGAAAFSNCANLKEITLSDGLNYLGDGAFMSCGKLESVTLPAGITKLSEGLFHSCTSLKSIVFLGNVTEISALVFRDCAALSELVVPASVTSIGGSAFYNCKALPAIIVPADAIMGEAVFYGWTDTQTINFRAAESKVDDFHENWNYNCQAAVIWGYTG